MCSVWILRLQRKSEQCDLKEIDTLPLGGCGSPWHRRNGHRLRSGRQRGHLQKAQAGTQGQAVLSQRHEQSSGTPGSPPRAARSGTATITRSRDTAAQNRSPSPTTACCTTTGSFAGNSISHRHQSKPTATSPYSFWNRGRTLTQKTSGEPQNWWKAALSLRF